MEIKVGMTVKIRSDLIEGKMYGNICYYCYSMTLGGEINIESIDLSDSTFFTDDGYMWYSFEMIEGYDLGNGTDESESELTKLQSLFNKLRYLVCTEHDRPELYDNDQIEEAYEHRVNHCVSCNKKTDKAYLAKYGMCCSCYERDFT